MTNSKKETQMIKFEEHDDNLFRMLEEPVPLTDDAELPVLVRLIQDDTMLGKANKRSCHPDTLAQKIICSSSKLTDDGLFMDGNYTYRYEIIGTLVEEGSAEWRNKQLQDGKPVHKEGDSEFYQVDGQNRIIGRIKESGEFNSTWNATTFMRDESDGWRIYEPKPLPMASTHDGLGDKFLRDCLKPNEHPIITGCNRLDYVPVEGIRIPKETEPEPAKEQFEVGDWVEIQWDDNSITHEQIVKVRQHEFLFQPNERCCYTAIQMDTMKHESMNIRCIRRLKPSEVIVHIGCLSGTIKDLSYAEDGRFWFIGEKTERCPGGMHAILYDEMLDPKTHELVKSLLKAQEEEK